MRNFLHIHFLAVAVFLAGWLATLAIPHGSSRSYLPRFHPDYQYDPALDVQIPYYRDREPSNYIGMNNMHQYNSDSYPDPAMDVPIRYPRYRRPSDHLKRSLIWYYRYMKPYHNYSYANRGNWFDSSSSYASSYHSRFMKYGLYSHQGGGLFPSYGNSGMRYPHPWRPYPYGRHARPTGHHGYQQYY